MCRVLVPIGKFCMGIEWGMCLRYTKAELFVLHREYSMRTGRGQQQTVKSHASTCKDSDFCLQAQEGCLQHSLALWSMEYPLGKVVITTHPKLQGKFCCIDLGRNLTFFNPLFCVVFLKSLCLPYLGDFCMFQRNEKVDDLCSLC